MLTAIGTFILMFSTLSGSRGVVRTPTNVRLTSYNMNLVLRWDSLEWPVSGLVYTTEYKASFTLFKVGCVNISTLECDLTSLNTSIFEFGKYTGRVRAHLGAESSPWIESNQIALDKDTIIGSPNVSLFSNGATIEVSIKDPAFAISALRNVYSLATYNITYWKDGQKEKPCDRLASCPKCTSSFAQCQLVTYNITYWKDGQKEKARSISRLQQNRVVLNELDPWTNYCIQVQINTGRSPNPNPSKPSEAVCESTTIDEEAPWVAAVVAFVVMAMTVALVVVTVVYRKIISHFLCPKDALPQHFKEYLSAHPNSSTYVAMRNSHPLEEIYDQISVITDSRTPEEGCPLEAADTEPT